MSREVFWNECADWLRKLREMWLRDMDSDMRFLLRLLISFSGCFTFLALFGLYSFSSEAAAPFLTAELVLSFLSIAGAFSIYLAFLLCWLPSKAGPVRRFLAALLLPAAVMFVVGAALDRFPDSRATPISQSE